MKTILQLKNVGRFLLLCVALLGMQHQVNAQTWAYDFGTGTGTANNSNAGSGKTDFFPSTPANGGTYRVRIGANGGSLILANPGTSLGSNSEVQLFSSTNNATNKFGVYNWTSLTNVLRLKFKLRTNATTTGQLNVSVGVSGMITDNNGFTGHYNNALASLRVNYAAGAITTVTRRTSGADNVITGSGIVKDTDQVVELLMNNASTSTTYVLSGSTYTLSAQSWDLWVDGTKISPANGWAKAGTLAANTSISAFGFFAETGASNAAVLYVDDLEYSNALPSDTPPTVSTTTASSITTTAAAAGGNVTSAGTASVTARGVAYATTATPTIAGSHTTDGSGTGTFSSSLTSLAVNTHYFYRAYATNSVGTSYGTENSFYTLANTPQVPVVDNETTTTLEVMIDDADGNPSTTEYAIQETTTGNYVTAGGTLGTIAWQTADAWGIKTVTGLSNNTTYTFQVKARNGANVETAFGGTASGLTETILDPYFETDNVATTFGSHCHDTNTQGSFDLYGFNLIDNAEVGPLEGFTFSTELEGTYTASLSLIPDGGAIAETIHVRFTPVLGQSYDGNITVTSTGAITAEVEATGSGIATVSQEVATAAATALTNTGATLHGNLSVLGVCPSTTEKGFVYALVSDNSDPEVDGTGVTAESVDGIATGAYSLPLTALAEAQEYVYKAYVKNADNTYSYGDAVTFMTVATAPSQPATIITFGTHTTSSIQLSWTNGNGAARIVVAKLSATAGAAPQNGVAYDSNSASFTDLLNDTTGTDNIVVYNGTGNTVTVTDLPTGTYNFSVYEYNGTGVTASYSSSAFGTKSTLPLEPTVQASNVTFSNVSATQFTINWTLGNGGNSLVIVKAGSAVDAVPVDGTSYSASNTNNPYTNGDQITTGNHVVYRAPLATLTVTGLTEGTTYHVAVYTYSGSAGSGNENYLTDGPATGSRTAETPTYYSQGSVAPNSLANWNSISTGGGDTPASFSGKFIIQGGHSMTTSGTWSFGTTGSTLEIQSGGSLTATSAITINSASTFRIKNGGSYIHSNGTAVSTTLFNGTEDFEANSNFTFTVDPNGITGLTGGYGNLTLNVTGGSGALGLSGNINTVKGNFTVTNTNNRDYRLSNATFTLNITGDFIIQGGNLTLQNQSNTTTTVNVGGDLVVTSGTLNLANSTGIGVINITGDVKLTGGTVSRTGNAPLSRINFTNTGLQEFTSGSTIGAVTFDIHSGSITNLGTAVISGTGAVNVLDGGTIQLGSTSVSGAIAGNITASGGLVLAANTTVEYNGTANQHITARSYGNLILSGSGTKTLNGNVTATNALTVSDTAEAIVPSGFDINTPVVTVDPTASLTFENNANLLQNPLAVANDNDGDIVYKRNSTMRRFDYVYWGSPVEGQNLGAFSPWTVQPQSPNPGATGNSRFYDLNEATSIFSVIAEPHNIEMVAGKGYMVRAPNNFPVAADPVTAPQATFNGAFTGRPNNGTITVPIAYSGAGRGYNLIGNPYPSSIDADLFLNYTPDEGVTFPNAGTLYFWTHYSQAANGGANYASYNGTGEAAAGDEFEPDGVIASGQGFLLMKTEAATEATFTNAMRIDNNAPHFFRNPNGTEKHRIWLNLSSPTVQQYNQALIGYVSGATQGVDTAYDGLLNFNGSSISTAIGSATDKYVIQGRALPFDASDVVPMIFKAATDGDYSISLDKVDGLFEGAQDIFLKDNLTGTVHDIKQSAYAFASNAGTFNNRFEIVFQSTLGVENPTLTENSVIVYAQDGVLNINSGTAQMSDVKVFDIRGRLLLERNGINANATSISGLNAAKQVLVVQVTANNATISKKVVY